MLGSSHKCPALPALSAGGVDDVLGNCSLRCLSADRRSDGLTADE